MLGKMNRKSNSKPIRGKTIDMGSVQATADIPKIISLEPLFGGLTLIWGILWLVIGATRS
jgi:hypothetical protein